MHLSAREIQLLGQEAQHLLSGAVIQTIKKTAQGWELLVRQPGQSYYLHLSFAPSFFYLVKDAGVTLPADGTIQVLRQILGGQRVSHFQVTERLLTLQTTDSICLYLELTGRHANGWLCDASATVRACWRKDRSERQLLIGQVYRPPQWSPKGSPLSQADRLGLAALPAEGQRSEAVAKHMAALAQRVLCEQLAQQIRQAWERYLAQISAQELGLAQAETQAPRLRREAELLQGAYGVYQGGCSQVTVTDYYHPDQPLITLSLDPAQDLARQVAARFAQARKQERAVTWISEQLLQQWSQQEVWSQQVPQWLAALEQGEYTAVAVSSQPLLKTLPKPSPRASQQAAQTRMAWHCFTAISGHTLWVGRSDRDNEALLKAARGSDLWLHIQDVPGSHVLVKLSRQEVCPESTLLDAATLALHFSRARGQSEAAIVYTPAKYVQRRKGAAPGEVYLQAHKVLQLRYEPARLSRLLTSD